MDCRSILMSSGLSGRYDSSKRGHIEALPGPNKFCLKSRHRRLLYLACSIWTYGVCQSKCKHAIVAVVMDNVELSSYPMCRPALRCSSPTSHHLSHIFLLPKACYVSDHVRHGPSAWQPGTDINDSQFGRWFERSRPRRRSRNSWLLLRRIDKRRLS